MGSPALYRNPELADLVFMKCSMGRQYLEQLDSQKDWRMQREAEPLEGQGGAAESELILSAKIMTRSEIAVPMYGLGI